MKEEKKGKLYLVATPIGNLEDITLRAINVLKDVDLIAAEDTRHTLKLLNHLKLAKPLMSYHRHNEDIKTDKLMDKLLEGENIALVSDAGTPGICDPGEAIVKTCVEKGIDVIPIPGACAMINALIASGIDTKEFTFLGFLPINKKLRKEKLHKIETSKETIILYEAPHKLMSTLNDLKMILGDRKVVLARELTKIYEQFIRGNIEEVMEKAQNLKGEIVLIVQGNKEIDIKQEFEHLSLEDHYRLYESQGLEKKEIIKKIAKDRKLAKNEVYQKFISHE